MLELFSLKFLVISLLLEIFRCELYLRILVGFGCAMLRNRAFLTNRKKRRNLPSWGRLALIRSQCPAFHGINGNLEKMFCPKSLQLYLVWFFSLMATLNFVDELFLSGFYFLSPAELHPSVTTTNEAFPPSITASLPVCLVSLFLTALLPILHFL